MFTIFKKEIAAYLSSLVAYITIGVFLLVLGLFLWVFPDSGILANGYASLESLFNIAPYLFMFLIPAITMRSVAEERREGTMELLATRPLTQLQILMGKYLACLTLVGFALLPTLIYYYSVYNLGNPQGNIDTGAVIGSYIGLFLLGATFTAIGIFTSAVSKNQIVAFTIAVFLCYFFFAGFDSLSQLLSLQSLNLQTLGINSHYESVSRGVLDTRDFAYFVVLSGIFILLALLALTLQQQRPLGQSGLYSAAAGLLGFTVLASLNITFNRFDFTTDKRFTLSPVSRDIEEHLQQPVKVTVYLQGNNFPGGMKRLQTATRDMLNDLQAYSRRRLEFEFKDPLAGVPQEQQNDTISSLQSRGIVATNFSVKTDDGVSQKIIFPAAMVQSGGNAIAVPLLQSRIGLSPDEVLNNSIENLEYAFTSAIKKVTGKGKPLIGFTTGHHELTDLQLNDARKSLSESYSVGRVDIKTTPLLVLNRLSLLVIPKPDMAFTEAEKFKTDQYLMQGGSILWTIDQVSAELDSLRGHGGEQLSFPKQLNLDDQLFTYGVRLNADLIADISCAQIPVATGNMGGQAQIQLLPWLFYPVFMPLAKHPVVRNLDGIYSEFAGTIDTIAIKNVHKTILLASSPYSRTFTAPYMLSLQALEREPNPKAFQSQPKPAAVLLEGQFKSAFQNRPVPAGAGYSGPVLSSSKPAKMIVISDGDVLKNQVGNDGSPFPLGYNRYSQQTYGNKNLLLNMADYLTGDSSLMSLRNKEVTLRLLDRARIRSEKMYWQVVNTVLPLLLLTILAIFQHYLRKRKYAR
ncbi:gliding motility-associated ABC transporter substrate-binding protein GldG [Mucilaginibacter sp.]